MMALRAWPWFCTALLVMALCSTASAEPSTSPNVGRNKGATQPAPAAQGETLITFSEFPPGTSITTQYKDQGIIFGGSGAFITGDGSNPTSPVLSGTPLFTGNISGKFVSPVNGAPTTVPTFSLDAGYFDQAHSTRLTWFGPGGQTLGTKTNAGLGIETFSVSDPSGIASWVLSIVGQEDSGFAIDNVRFPINVTPSVRVSTADLVTNEITVKIVGFDSTWSGTLSVAVRSDNAKELAVNANSGAPVGNGTYKVALPRLLLPFPDKPTTECKGTPCPAPVKYSTIVATWKPQGDAIVSEPFNVKPPWLVNGETVNTQYNTPSEPSCRPTPIQAWIFDSACNFTQTILSKQFADQTYINGTGRSSAHGLLKSAEKSCTSSRPPGATGRNSFLSIEEPPTGACNKAMQGNFLAAYPNPAKMGQTTPRCGDNVLLLDLTAGANQGIKLIEDYCPWCRNCSDCKSVPHFDNYSSSDQCSLNDLQNNWTANIGRPQ